MKSIWRRISEQQRERMEEIFYQAFTEDRDADVNLDPQTLGERCKKYAAIVLDSLEREHGYTEESAVAEKEELRDAYERGKAEGRREQGTAQRITAKSILAAELAGLPSPLETPQPVSEQAPTKGCQLKLEAELAQLAATHREPSGEREPWRSKETVYREVIDRLTAAASRHEAELVEAVRMAADAAAQDAQVIVTSLGNVESAMAESAPESFCKEVSQDFERAMKAALRLKPRVLALTPADIRQRVAEREVQIFTDTLDDLEHDGVNLIVGGKEGVRIFNEPALAAHDLKVRQDFAERVVTLLTECEVYNGRLVAAIRQLATEPTKADGE